MNLKELIKTTIVILLCLLIFIIFRCYFISDNNSLERKSTIYANEGPELQKAQKLIYDDINKKGK